MRKVAVVTGVAGFIGSHLAKALLECDYKVIGVDDLSKGRIEMVPPGVDFYENDISEQGSLSSLPREADAVFHLAGQSSSERSFHDPSADALGNVLGTVRLLDWVVASGAKRFLYASSMAVYGNPPGLEVRESHVGEPISYYGVSKFAAEGYVRLVSSRVPAISIRMFNVYGPGQDFQDMQQGMVSIFLSQAVSQGLIQVRGHGQRIRDFIYITDVVDSWISLAESPRPTSGALNLGTGIPTTVDDLVTQIAALLPGSKIEFGAGTPGDPNGFVSDNSKFVSLFGKKKLVSINTGLASTVASIG